MSVAVFFGFSLGVDGYFYFIFSFLFEDLSLFYLVCFSGSVINDYVFEFEARFAISLCVLIYIFGTLMYFSTMYYLLVSYLYSYL